MIKNQFVPGIVLAILLFTSPWIAASEPAVPPPVFAQPGGWYEDALWVELTTTQEGDIIYYTLDGSEPDEQSRVYTEPIPVHDRQGEPNNLSRITTGTYPSEPRSEVFKGTVIRARVFTEENRFSQTATHTYFIHPDGAMRYSVPVLSIVASYDDLFDYEGGIYVPGKIYDDEFDPERDLWALPANYTQRGREWERPGHLEFFETDGRRVLAQNIGIRVHGGATRSYPQKTLRLYARRSYDAQHYFRHEIFPELTRRGSEGFLDEYKRLLLRSSGNDWYNTLFRDAFMQQLTAHTGLDTQAYRPAVVFINGEYWGIHNLRERYDQYYLKTHYGIDEEESVILEGGGHVNHGLDGDEKHYHAMLEYLRENDIRDDEHYAYIRTQMDVDNYLDYQISQIYFGNHDWPGNNIKFWRARTDEYMEDAGPLDGRWRWLLYDTDFGFSLYGGEEGYKHPTLELATRAGGEEWPNPDWSTFLLRTLLQNYDFQTEFISRFADYLNTSFLPAVVVNQIDQFEEQLRAEIAEHSDRWRTPDSPSRWSAQVDALRTFAQRRPSALYEQISQHFRLQGTAVLRIEADSAMGYVQVNSLVLGPKPMADGDSLFRWSGTYLKGVPVTLSAHPLEGYRFAGWQGLDEADSSIVSVLLDGDAGVTAHFVSIGETGIVTAGGGRDGGRRFIYYLVAAAVVVLTLTAILLLNLTYRKDKRNDLH